MKRLLVLGSTGIRITTAGVRGGRRRRRCCCCWWPRGEENARPGRSVPDAQERTAGSSEARRGRKPPQAPRQVEPSPPLPVPVAPASPTASRSSGRSSGGASSRGPVALLVRSSPVLAAKRRVQSALAGDSPGPRDPSRPLQLRSARPLASRCCSPVGAGLPERKPGRGGEPRGGQTSGWPDPRALLWRASRAQSKYRRLRQNKAGFQAVKGSRRGSSRGSPSRKSGRSQPHPALLFPCERTAARPQQVSSSLSLSPPGSSWPRFLLRLTSTPGALLALRPLPASS